MPIHSAQVVQAIRTGIGVLLTAALSVGLIAFFNAGDLGYAVAAGLLALAAATLTGVDILLGP